MERPGPNRGGEGGYPNEGGNDADDREGHTLVAESIPASPVVQ